MSKIFDTDTTVQLKASPNRNFFPIRLPGQDYIPGPQIFPSSVIAGYYGDLNDYTSATWTNYLLEEANKFADSVTVFSCSALNSGSTGGRYWFGYIFRKPYATAADFLEAKPSLEVRDAQAFTALVGN